MIININQERRAILSEGRKRKMGEGGGEFLTQLSVPSCWPRAVLWAAHTATPAPTAWRTTAKAPSATGRAAVTAAGVAAGATTGERQPSSSRRRPSWRCWRARDWPSTFSTRRLPPRRPPLVVASVSVVTLRRRRTQRTCWILRTFCFMVGCQYIDLLLLTLVPLFAKMVYVYM